MWPVQRPLAPKSSATPQSLAPPQGNEEAATEAVEETDSLVALNQARALHARGDLAEAERLYEAAFAAVSGRFSDDSPVALLVYEWYAKLLRDTGRIGRALELQTRADRIRLHFKQ